MGKVYAPVSAKAIKPYFLDKLCINIYSVDELIFSLCDNPQILSRDMFTKDLSEWIDEECNSKEIAAMLMKLISQKASVLMIVKSLMAYASFLSSDEKERIERVMKDGESSSDFDKRKARGDFFLGKERYANAIREYEALLQGVGNEESDRVAKVYHNMGVAKARMYLFEQASEDFLRAYDCDDNEEHYYAYIATLRFSMTDTEYVKKIGDDSSMREVTLLLETDIENVKKGFKESSEYLDFVSQKEEENEKGRSAFCAFLDSKINEKKEEYNKYVY